MHSPRWRVEAALLTDCPLPTYRVLTVEPCRHPRSGAQMPGVSLRDTGGLVLTLQRRLYTLGPTELRGRPDEHGLQIEGPLEGTTGGDHWRTPRPGSGYRTSLWHLPSPGSGHPSVNAVPGSAIPATLPAQGSHMQPCLHYQRGF